MDEKAVVPYGRRANSPVQGPGGSNPGPGSPSTKEAQRSWRNKLHRRQDESEKPLKAGKRNLSNRDKIILVVGGTGTGKSRFINALGCNRKRAVGHSLQSQTRHVSLHRPKLNSKLSEDGTESNAQHEVSRIEESPEVDGNPTQGKSQSEVNPNKRSFNGPRTKGANPRSSSESDFVVVDTPGFGDTNVTDVEIIQRIVSWLAKLDRQKFQLSGILFFHRITDNRISGASRKSFELFRDMAGEVALKNTILVTSMWDKVLAEPDLGPILSREAELKKLFWGEDSGRMERFAPTLECAKRIIDLFENSQGFQTEIVHEVIVKKVAFAETKVGHRIADIASRAKEEHRQNLEAVEHESRRAAGDPEKRAIWEAEQKRLKEEGDKLDKEQEQLNTSNPGSLNNLGLARKPSRRFLGRFRAKAQ